MPEYRKPPKKSWRHHGRRVITFVGTAVILAIIGASITTSRVNWLGESVSDLFNDAPAKRSTAEIVTDQLFALTRWANIWDGTPTMYPQSRRYIIKYFRSFDPRIPHPYVLPGEPVLSPEELVVRMPLFVGSRVTVVGRIRAINIGGWTPTFSHLPPPGHPHRRATIPNVNFIAQLGGRGKGRTPLVYVLYTDAVVRELQPDQWIAVVGVPIAGGTFKLNAGGFTPGAYLVAGSVEPVKGPGVVIRSVRRLVKKRRRISQHCQPHPSTAFCRYVNSRGDRAP
jgi:hypothetical protein